MKGLYRVITMEGSHEYDIIVSYRDNGEKIFKLYNSNSESWTYPSKHIMTIEDDLNFNVKLPKLNRTIGVDIAGELALLIRFTMMHDSEQYIGKCLSYNILPATSKYTI